ncbi:MAG: hypothetical protein ABIB43_06260 [archaeon]
MILKKAIEKIESSDVFKAFKKDNPDFYLAHAFTIIERVQQEWQVGYYSKTKDKVVVFLAKKEIEKSPEEEVFKKPGKKVKELKLANIKVGLERAIDISNKVIDEKYSAEYLTKTIVILQNLETEMYNLTLVSQSMNIINIKIDAKSGKVLSEGRQSIMGLRKE